MTNSSRKRLLTELSRKLFAPVDIASLVYFRIAFGAILLWEVWRYLEKGWIKRYYIDPDFHFTYLGFDWVRPWPGDGMYYHFYALGILAIFMAMGFMYGLSTTLFFLGFTYVFLLEKARYLNHFYLVSLVGLLMIFVPAQRLFSMDARRRPRIVSETVPAWPLWLLRGQMGIVYFFGGVAKLNGDWLRGYPMRRWLPKHNDFPIIGSLFDEPAMALLFSWGGLLIDLSAVPFLLWQRTRMHAFLALVGFQLMNAQLFSLGIFPWFAIAMTLLFFPPDWPRRVFNWPRLARTEGPDAGRFHPTARHWATVGVLGICFALQTLVPLRHWLYPGEVSWTEEGHNFSWHMKLRHKAARVRFLVTDRATNKTWQPKALEYLAPWQYRKMTTRPPMILQFAHYLAEQARKEGHEQVEVRVQAIVALNGREPQMLIDPETDLAAQPRTFLAPAAWIVPLETPLPTRD